MKSATKSASLESKQYLDEHKESTKSELHKISSKDDLSDKQKKVLTNLLLDDVKTKQGTEDFKKHAEVRKADYKKIRELVIERVGDAKKVTKEDIQEAVDFFYGKSDKKEVKEKIEGLPELADKNFRVEDTKGWKEVTDPNGVKVLENLEGDVREYLEGDCKGEQLFTQDSALREAKKAGKTLPASWTTYRDIIEKKYEGNYQDFLKGENMMFPGWRGPGNEKFNDVDKGFNLRCADGSCFGGDGDGWSDDAWGKNWGFSVRCLKD